MLNKIGLASTAQTFQGPASLARILPSACFDLDATLVESYAGTGQGWSNIVANPADGSLATAYDFYRGNNDTAQSDDPAFTGTAGQQSGYWLLDGGDAFKQIATTTLLANLHKADGDSFTVIAAFQYQPSSSEQRLFSTQANGSTGPGLTIGINSTKKLMLRQKGDSGTSVSSLTAVTLANADYLCIVSHDRNANNTRYWINSRTGTTVAHTFLAATGTALTPAIGARASFDLDFLTANTRVYSMGFLNAAIDDAAAGLIYNLLNDRHGRVYA